MLKGFFALILAGLISLSPSAPETAPEIAPERGRREGAIHPWDTVTDNLDPSSYSAIYTEDDRLHIAAVDKVAVLRVVLQSGVNLTDIVIAPGMKYTHQQLLDAQDKLMGDHEYYGINSIFLQPQNNRITVSSPVE